jgi:hypothetical protein
MAQGGNGPGRRNYTSRAKTYTTQAAKDKFVELIQDGLNIGPALEKVGFARKTYEEWRRKDPAFKARVDQARQLRGKREVVRGERLGFAEWRLKYLGVETPWHQMQWVDLLEGREPRDLHSSQTFVRGKRNRVLVNCPPFHGKTIAITIDYVTYRLCLDPGFRVLLISAGTDLAKDFVFGVAQRLTSPDFIDLQLAYAPEGGWEATAKSWTESKIVFGTEVRSQSGKAFHEKDANVLALGMRSKVYGRRCDLAIVDDGVDTTNVSEYAKQMKWLRSMIESRIEGGGKLLVVGTRVSAVDLYSELMKPENYANGVSPWTYLASPAILEEAADPKDHVTLWPMAQAPWVDPADVEMDECLCEETESCTEGSLRGDGSRQYARWDGIHLERGPRASNSAADWALIYQQKSVPEDATFPEHAVTKATNGLRLCGNLEKDRTGHPLGGMHGKYVIASLDPSIKGFAGMLVIAVDKESQKRYLLNAWNLRAPTKDQLTDKMKQVTETYGVSEWRVEKTGLLQFFTQDSVLRAWFSTRGVRFTEHHTGSNKWDASFGVSSLASLFGEYDRSYDNPNGEWREINAPLIELPRPNTDGVKALIHQLITWTPELDPGKVPCDMVMALWFAEIGAREHLGYGRGSGSLTVFGRSNKFVSPRSSRNRQTVNLADYRGVR